MSNNLENDGTRNYKVRMTCGLCQASNDTLLVIYWVDIFTVCNRLSLNIMFLLWNELT